MLYKHIIDRTDTHTHTLICSYTHCAGARTRCISRHFIQTPHDWKRL